MYIKHKGTNKALLSFDANRNFAKVGTIESVDFDVETNTFDIFADNANITVVADEEDVITYSATEEDELMTFADTASELIDLAIQWQEANGISIEQMFVDYQVKKQNERLMEVLNANTSSIWQRQQSQ